MKYKKNDCRLYRNISLSKLLLLSFLWIPVTGVAYELEAFGTISTQVESVSPGTKTDNDYTNFRDTYTRVALKLGHELDNGVSAFALLELPFDTVNMEINNTFDQDRTVFDSTERLAYIQLNLPAYGSIWVGRGWEPYYSSVSASVDRFNSYYRGYATYSVLRVEQAIVYSSPDLNGVSFSVMHAHKNGYKKSNGQYDDRNQLTVSYNIKDTKLGFGFTDAGGENSQQLVGVSLSHKIKDFYIAAKYERHSSDVTDKRFYGNDGSDAMNFYVEYKKGLHKINGHIAKVDNFGGDIFHLGYDYQYSKHIKLFAEYYQEQTGAAITRERKGFADTYWREGGQALLVGFSFDFSKKFFER
ncbi:MAG: porin [Cycloclasticus sp.]